MKIGKERSPVPGFTGKQYRIISKVEEPAFIKSETANFTGQKCST